MRVHYMGYILFFPFGLPPCIPLLQRPIRHATSSLLDFLRALLYFNVQSVAQLLHFWTSTRLHSTSTSNSPRNFFPFGLPPCSPLLQRPIRRSFPFLLDFNSPPLHFNVQSATLARSFWTSSVLSSTSTSNPPLLSVPFGLLLAFPPLQRPIRHSFSSLLDFRMPSHCFNVQSQSVLSTISSIANILIANFPTMCV